MHRVVLSSWRRLNLAAPSWPYHSFSGSPVPAGGERGLENNRILGYVCLIGIGAARPTHKLVFANMPAQWMTGDLDTLLRGDMGKWRHAAHSNLS